MRRIIISTERCMACSLLGSNPTKGEMFFNSKEDDGRSNSNTKCKCLEETHNMLARSDWNILKNEERLFHAPEAKSAPYTRFTVCAKAWDESMKTQTSWLQPGPRNNERSNQNKRGRMSWYLTKICWLLGYGRPDTLNTNFRLSFNFQNSLQVIIIEPKRVSFKFWLVDPRLVHC